MTYKMFWGEAVPSRKKNKVLVLNLFTQTRYGFEYKKTASVKLSIKVKKEKTKEKNQKKKQSRKGLCLPNATEF